MTEKALTTLNTTGTRVMVPQNYVAVEGLEELTFEEDLVLPRWRIVQFSSTIDGEPGQFNNNLTEQPRDDLELIVLKVSPSRAYFDENRKLVCMSRNAIHSTGGKACLGCPLAQWGNQGEPPACSRGYTLVCVDIRDNSLCLLGALRTSVPPVKLWFSKLAHAKTPPFHHVTRFTTVQQVGPKGKYFTLLPETAAELSQTDKDQARQQYQSLASVRIVEAVEPTYDEFGPNGTPEGPPPGYEEYDQPNIPF